MNNDNKVLIPFALVNNKIKNLNDINKGDEVYCLECGEKLVLKAGDVRVKHLAHCKDTTCRYGVPSYQGGPSGGGESYEHKYIKHYLKDNLTKFKLKDYFINIKRGELVLNNHMETNIKRAEVEFRDLTSMFNLTEKYIPDLILWTDRGIVIIEIYKTNRKDPAHIKSLFDNVNKDIYVYEIDINNIDIDDIGDLYKHTKLLYSHTKSKYDDYIDAYQELIFTNNHNAKVLKDKDFKIEELNAEVYTNVREIWKLEELLVNQNRESNVKLLHELKYTNKQLKEELEEYKDIMSIAHLKHIEKHNASVTKKLEDEVNQFRKMYENGIDNIEQLKTENIKLNKLVDELKKAAGESSLNEKKYELVSKQNEKLITIIAAYEEVTELFYDDLLKMKNEK